MRRQWAVFCCCLIPAWLALASAGVAATQPQFGETCDDIPAFEPKDRYYFNKLHRRLVRSTNEGATVDIGAFSKLREAVKKKHGAGSAAYAIVSLDQEASTGTSDDTAEQGGETEDWLDLLYKRAKTAQEIEALAGYTAAAGEPGDGSPPSYGSLGRLVLNVAARHKALHGPQPGQLALIAAGFPSGMDIDHKAQDLIEVGLEMESLGNALGSDRAVYAGQGRRLAGLLKAGRKEEAAALAAQLEPQAKARLEWAADRIMGDHVDVCWHEPVYDSLISALGPSPERARLAMLEDVSFQQTETHGAAVWYPFVSMLSYRAESPAGFREAMRLGAVKAQWGPPSEVWFAVLAGGALAQAAEPALAREYLKQAVEWSSDGDVSAELRFYAIAALADFEWASGSASQVDQLVQDLETLVSESRDKLPDEMIAGLHAFKAQVADARLRDDEAVAELGEAVNILVKAIKQSEEEDDSAASDQQAIGWPGGAGSLIYTLLMNHLDGRFCGPCGTGLQGAVRAWTEATLENFGAEEVLFAVAVLLSKSPAMGNEARAAATKALRSMIDQDAANGTDVRPALKTYRGLVSRDKALVLAGLHLAIAKRMQDEAPIDEFLTSDDDETRAAVAAMMGESLYDFELEFAGRTQFFLSLTRLVRLLDRAGLPAHAKLMNDQMLRYAEMEEDGEAYFDVESKRALAGELGLAYARQAAGLYDVQLWAEADQAAGKALDLLADRLMKDWRLGSERTVLLYRAFHPAIKLAAQTRFRLAANADARDDLPDVGERAFRALQLAMLGETAFATQAAIQTRMLRDPQAREALARRDEAAFHLAQVDAVEAAIPSNDQSQFQRTRSQGEAALKLAESQLAALLPTLDPSEGLGPKTIGEVRAVLARDQALLTLHGTESGLLAIFLSPAGEVDFVELDITATDLNERITQLRREVASFGAIDLENASALHESVLGPFNAQLADVRHLIVVADGPLLGLPWGALSTGTAKPAAMADVSVSSTRGAVALQHGSGSNGADLSAVPWLIRKFPVSIVPGIASLFSHPDPNSALQPFLGIGDPVLTGDTPLEAVDMAALKHDKRGVNAALISRLAPLPETAAELASIAQALGASSNDILLASNATEARLRSLQLDSYNVIAFATHGVLAGEIGGYAEPGLVLTAEDAQDPSRDGYLSLSEIMGLKVNADLIILSACNTGAADGRPRAEWMSGLTKGFISAGANQLLVTLWSIPSEPTVRLTTGMVNAHRVAPHAGWPKALQDSIVAMLDRPERQSDAHPASWAGFVLFGAASPAPQQ